MNKGTIEARKLALETTMETRVKENIQYQEALRRNESDQQALGGAIADCNHWLEELEKEIEEVKAEVVTTDNSKSNGKAKKTNKLSTAK